MSVFSETPESLVKVVRSNHVNIVRKYKAKKEDAVLSEHGRASAQDKKHSAVANPSTTFKRMQKIHAEMDHAMQRNTI